MISKARPIYTILVFPALLIVGCKENPPAHPVEPTAGFIPDPASQIIESTVSIQHYPNYSAPYHNRGMSRRLLGDFQGAIADLNEAIRLDPAGAYVSYTFLQRGIAFAQLGDLRKALVDLNRSIALDATTDAIFERAEVYRALNLLEKSLDDYDACRDRGATLYQTLRRTSLLVKLGDVEQAMRDYTALGKIFPHDPRIFFYRADLSWNMGNYASAIADYVWAIFLSLQGRGREDRLELQEREFYFFQDSSDHWQRMIDQLDKAVRTQRAKTP